MEIVIFIAGVILGAIVAFFWMGNKNKTNDDLLSKSHQAVEERKNAAKENILEHIKEKGTVNNDDVESLLGVSDATATRYLQELEQEGKIIQEGETRGVVYRIKIGSVI